MRLDGPIGTLLIDQGVGPEQVLDATFTAPERVAAAHRAYVAAGAELILSNTFALPFQAARRGFDDAEIARYLDAAIALATGAGGGAQVWLALGPPGSAHGVMQRILTCAAARIKHGPAMGVWLETLGADDATWLPRSLAALGSAPYALSFMLTDTPPAALSALASGAVAFGGNCSAFDPNDTGRMLRALDAWAVVPGIRIGKPSLGAGNGRVVLAHAAARFAWAGACCGGTPAALAAMETT